MAIPFERLVEEDLNLGTETIVVTSPAGGTMSGRQISRATFHPYSVHFFGARGDGVSDDTAAVQRAINAAAANGGGVVYFPNGTYRMTAEVDAKASGVKLLGETRDGAVLIWDDTANRGLVFDTAVVDPDSSAFTANAAVGDRVIAVVSGATFVAGAWVIALDSGSHTGSLLTRVKSVSGNNVTLEDGMPCTLTTGAAATLFTYRNHPLLEGISVKDLTLRCTSDTPANLLTLLLLSRCSRYRVVNCRFSGSTGPLMTTNTCYGGVTTRSIFEHGATVANTGLEHQKSTGCSVDACHADLCQFGFVASQSPYTRVVNSRVAGRATTVALGRGIKYQDNSNFGVISGCTITDANLYAIYMQDAAYCSITGNTAGMNGVDADEHGIQMGGFLVGGSHHCTITGNTITGSTGYGIAINDGGNNGTPTTHTIAGNTISRCTDGAIFCNGAYNSIVGNTVSGAGATVSGGIIRVDFGGDYNTIAANTISNEDGTSTNAIRTGGGGGGHNLIAHNAIGPNLVYSLSATDTVGASQAYVTQALTRAPVFTHTSLATGADLTETTAWTVTIPGTVLSASTHGFRMRGVLTFAGNTNTKTVRVKIGTGPTVFLGQDNTSGGPFQIEFDLEVHWVDNANAAAWCNFWTTKVNANGFSPGGTGGTAIPIDWTVDQTITVTMQNGTASAGDITFRQGKLTFEGVPQGVL